MSFGKNRMHSTLAKYALSLDTQSDIYAPKWHPQLMQLICSFPDETRRCMEQELELLDQVQEQIHRLEARIVERVQMIPTIQLIQSIPGPAKILSIVIDREVGSIHRFPSPHHFASYSGLVPKLSCPAARATALSFSHNSAGKARPNFPHARQVSCSELLGGGEPLDRVSWSTVLAFTRRRFGGAGYWVGHSNE